MGDGPFRTPAEIAADMPVTRAWPGRFAAAVWLRAVRVRMWPASAQFWILFALGSVDGSIIYANMAKWDRGDTGGMIAVNAVAIAIMRLIPMAIAKIDS